MVMLVSPREFVEVMESMPAMVENCFSSGVATEEAIVSGLAPGREALTKIVGKSTLGRSLTGNSRYAKTPKIKIAAMTKVVIMGRLMKSSERLTVRLRQDRWQQPYLSELRAGCLAQSLSRSGPRAAGRSQLRAHLPSGRPKSASDSDTLPLSLRGAIQPCCPF